jgi:hypothetical protein
VKYHVPRLRADPGAAGSITATDGTELLRVETVLDERSPGVVLRSPDGQPRATVRLERALMGTAAKVEVDGEYLATLSCRGGKPAGAVRVRSHAGDYDIAGDFDAWDFHVLLDASPVADIAPRKTEPDAALVETSDTEAQLPLLAMILAVDLLVQTSS